MKRRWLLPNVASALVISAAVAALTPSRAAAVEPPECPPGEWFCDDAEQPEGPPESDPAPPEWASESGSEWSADPDGEAAPPRRWSERDRPEIDVRRRPPAEPVERDERPTRGRGGASPWSVNLRLEGVLLGQGRGRSHDARMGGVGASIRYAVNPVLTVDVGVDSLLGRDYNGYERSEASVSLSTLLYLNQHRLIRTYGIFGLNSSAARVDIDGDDQDWGYFGAHAGLGLDIALDRRVALNLDLLGFMRGRTDGRAAREPEFIDASGRVSNTSGGGLFRGGFTLHF